MWSFRSDLARSLKITKKKVSDFLLKLIVLKFTLKFSQLISARPRRCKDSSHLCQRLCRRLGSFHTIIETSGRRFVERLFIHWLFYFGVRVLFIVTTLTRHPNDENIESSAKGVVMKDKIFFLEFLGPTKASMSTNLMPPAQGSEANRKPSPTPNQISSVSRFFSWSN